ncbi:LOW QUALITY PROTEIN: metalloreductase STEAP2 [Elysia marginata]|uniref:Metalloreductase STEAP2 n=1 Tax=Elysia marginata TaxID=1093978 RepID=A0AAV4HJ17_9GAST|nr:LOW QUALITY PROTEIN: metalloreductase STEAP2 [Elysia marginata]
MGFRAVNLGLLKASRWMEDDLLSVFPLWKMPIALATAIFVLAWVLVVYIYFINRDKPAYSWEQLFMKVLNKPVCMTAIAMMALTYLPGQLASVLQIYYGTKHRRFPQFMDFWLKCRKQMGLVSFFLVIIHAVLSVMMISPTYYGSWFHKATVTVPANSTLNSALVLTVSKHWMTWKGESACLLGTLAFVLMGVVAVTSIRSVGDSLNWSECTVMGAQGWQKRGFPKVFLSITFVSVLLPYLVLAMKLAFSLPPLSGYLRKIRRGWEREGARYGDLEGGGNGQQGYCNPPGSSGGAEQGNGDCCGDNIELEKSGAGAAFGGNKNVHVRL